MNVLRTPDERCADLPDFPYEPNYTDIADGEGGTLYIATPTPTMPEMMAALTSIDPGTRARKFAYWQKWTWEAEGQPHQTIEGGGHFLQEGRGEVLASIVSDFVRTR